MKKNNYNKNMKNILSLIICLISLTLTQLNVSAQNVQTGSQFIQKGTFIRGITPTEISTSTNDIGDEVVFINTSDMYLENTNAIPRGSKLTGVVEDIREPVQGTNAAIKIKIDTITTPDKRTLKTEAYVFGDNDNYLGGEITPPLYYHKIPHYTKGWNEGVLQYTPSNVRGFGQHKTIKAGSEVFIILNDNLKIF